MTFLRESLSIWASRRVSSMRYGLNSAAERALAMSCEVRAATSPIGMGSVTLAAGQPPTGSLSGWKVVAFGSEFDMAAKVYVVDAHDVGDDGKRVEWI